MCDKATYTNINHPVYGNLDLAMDSDDPIYGTLDIDTDSNASTDNDEETGL